MLRKVYCLIAILAILPSFTANATTNLSSFSVFATNSVWLYQGSDVNSGNIGVVDSSPGPWLDSQSEVSVGINVYVADGISVYGDSIKVKTGASAFDVSYNELTNNGTIRGSEQTPLVLPLDVTMPPFPTPAPGTEDHDIPLGGSLTLAPGSYGEIMVRKNATLTLTGGTYHFENLDLGDLNAKVLFQTPTDLIINNRLGPGKSAVIGPEVGSGISANDIRIYVNGINGGTGNLGATPKAAQIGETNTLQANIYAPNGTVLIKQGTVAEGAFIGKDVKIGQNVQVTINSGFGGSGSDEDLDGDGFSENQGDCNDNDANEYPGQTWYKDSDDDGYSDGTTDTASCVRPTGYKTAAELTANTGDCNDNDPTINPVAQEVCDGGDNNCDGQIDEGVKTTYYADTDSDGHGDPNNSSEDCTQPSGYVTDNTDCNDNDANEHPGQTWYNDSDDDGYSDGTLDTASCGRPTGYKTAAELTAITGDCDDGNSSINPDEVEVCDDVDNNCDGQIDEGLKTTFYEDSDGDGYGNPGSPFDACSQPSGYVANSGDSDDADPAINPDALEICDGIDNNSNGQIDEGVMSTFYADSDGDGYGDANATTEACQSPSGYVSDNTDCDDGNSGIHPTATDIPANGIDENCDGSDPPLVTISTPETLSTVGSSPITVTGTISNPAATVTVNGVTVAVNGNTYTVSGIALEEGANTITAMAVDSSNNVNTDNITVYLDSTPPNVTISSPENGYVATSSPVTVTGSLNDIVIGTVNESNATVTVNGVTATVSNNTFMAGAIPLAEGANVITAVAADQTGNTASNTINVTLDLSSNKKIEMVSGDGQSGVINTSLTNPLFVSLKNSDGSPAVGKTVIFKVTQNNGQLTGSNGTATAIATVTDSNGKASALFTLGSTSGEGNNRVEAFSVGFTGKVLFTASALQGSPYKINVGSGNNQRGAVLTPLSRPLVAVVTDEGHNVIKNVPVTFTVTAGGGTVNGSGSVVVNTDSDGRATVSFKQGSQEGINNNIVEADFVGNSASPVVFNSSGLAIGDPGATSISGLVLDNSNLPIPGVTMRVEHTTREATTDDEGQFLISNVPVGALHLIADGSTATFTGEYPVLSFELVTVAGQKNTLGMPIYMLPLNTTNTQWVGGTEDVVYTLENIPGFSLTIKKNSVTFPDGSNEGFISVTQVNADKVPMEPPNGLQPRFIITIQPPGAVFDPPAPVTIPNVDGLSPGEITKMYSFDHDMGQFVIIGTGTVSEDGSVVKSDSGVGVIKAGWHCGGNPAITGACSGRGGNGDTQFSVTCPGSIIEAQNQILGEGADITGTPFRLFYKSDRVPGKTDVTTEFDARDLGLGGWSLDVHHAYKSTGKIFYGDGTNRTGKNVNGDPDVNDIVILSPEGSRLYYFDSDNLRHLRTVNAKSDLTLYTFAYNASGLLMSITDSDSDVTTIERVANKPTAIISHDGQRTDLTLNGDDYLETITNPASEKIEFTYYNEGLLKTMKDRRGNIYNFGYDSSGRLVSDANPAGGSWTLSRTGTKEDYTTTMTSAMGRAYSYNVKSSVVTGTTHTNTGPAGLVTNTVRMPDGSYTTTLPDGTVNMGSEAKDPRWGNKLYLPSNRTITTPNGLTNTQSIGRSVTLNTKTLPDSTEVPDPMSLKTETVTVNINGDVYSTLYDADINKTTSTTPEGRTTVIDLDTKDRIVQIQAGSLEPVANTYDTRGRLQTMKQGTGANERSVTLTYNPDGYLHEIKDSYTNITSFEYDLAGRITKETLKDNREIGYTYDKNGNVTSITPPGRPVHLFTYTAVDLQEDYNPPNAGTSVNSTTYSYNLDKQLKLITRPDGKSVSYNYDSGGRIDKVTIPRGDTTYTYDETTGTISSIKAPDGGTLAFTYDGFLALDSTWAGGVSGKVSRVYDNNFQITSRSVNDAHTINFVYDDDSLITNAGDITITRDALNGLITNSGIDNITGTRGYNIFGDPSSYTAAFEGADFYTATYTRDKLGRITQKVESVEGVTHTYDYTYELTDRLKEVKIDGTVVSLYQYDDNGNRLSVTKSGTTTISGTYDDQDRMTQYDNTTYTYTDNGELLTSTTASQTTTYDYDVLGNLVSVTMPDATLIEYIVDGAGRRIGKRVDGVLVQGFLYKDQLNPIAELDDAGNVVSRFVYGSRFNVPDYMIKGGNTYRIISDHLGSPRIVADTTTGQIVQQVNYDEFGNILSDTNPGFQPFGFAGGIYDQDTKLVRFGARDYDPATGRWTAKDLIFFAGGDTNLYGYVQNNPVNFIDPDGLVKDFLISQFVNKTASSLSNTFIKLDPVSRRVLSAGIGGASGGAVAGFFLGSPTGPGAGITTFGGAVAGFTGGLLVQSILEVSGLAQILEDLKSEIIGNFLDAIKECENGR